MCSRCDDPHATHATHALEGHSDRRAFLASGATIAAGAAIAGGLPLAAARAAPAPAKGVSTRGWGTDKATERLKPVSFKRRDLRPDDILIDILYAGVCHSDIHVGRGEWGPVDALTVPGHEIVGRVAAVGRAVTKFKVGDHAGVGCMVDSCGTCAQCKAGQQQYCLNGNTGTYGRGPTGEMAYGGYSNNLVVRESFAITIPAALDLRSAAPLMCAGITTFSPMQRWKLARGQKVGILGLGGLGHMALKLAHARGAEATVFTTSPGKRADALRMGAKEAVLWSDTASFKRLAGQFDLLLSTVPEDYDVNPFLPLLTIDGTMVNVGVFGGLAGFSNAQLILGRRSLAGSAIGGIAETQEVVDYCAANRIAPEVEMIPIARVNEAWDRVVAKDVRYRFVIDMASLKA